MLCMSVHNQREAGLSGWLYPGDGGWSGNGGQQWKGTKIADMVDILFSFSYSSSSSSIFNL